MDSQIFDRLKLELGLKNFNKLIKEKLAPIPLDLVSYSYLKAVLVLFAKATRWINDERIVLSFA